MHVESLPKKLHPKEMICTCHYRNKGDYCLKSICCCWKWWDLWLRYPSAGMVHAQGAVTVLLPPWQLLSLLAGKVIKPLAESYHGSMWTYLWARTTFLETLVIRRETLLGLCIQEGSQCGQQISKMIWFWQCVLFRRWTVTFCSIWNVFSMHDFLS